MRLLILALVQSLLLSGGQVLLKLAMAALPRPSLTWAFVRAALADWPLAGCGLCYGAATVLWLYILRHFPFAQAYPMVSLSYVFGMLAAIFVFGEDVSWTGWAGVVLIMAGCWLVAQ